MAPPQQLRQQTSNCSLLLIYRPRKDERLSWPSWLTYSGWLTHISGHTSATSRAQDSESTSAKDRQIRENKRQTISLLTVWLWQAASNWIVVLIFAVCVWFAVNVNGQDVLHVRGGVESVPRQVSRRWNSSTAGAWAREEHEAQRSVAAANYSFVSCMFFLPSWCFVVC